MSQSIPEERRSRALSALELLEKALQLLDAIDAPANIGAHVDLAICQLRDALEATQ
jgi:hypothetical protein